MSMFLFFTLVIPTACYFSASAYLAVHDGNWFDAMMFFGYAFANIGVILRLVH